MYYNLYRPAHQQAATDESLRPHAVDTLSNAILEQLWTKTLSPSACAAASALLTDIMLSTQGHIHPVFLQEEEHPVWGVLGECASRLATANNQGEEVLVRDVVLLLDAASRLIGPPPVYAGSSGGGGGGVGVRAEDVQHGNTAAAAAGGGGGEGEVVGYDQGLAGQQAGVDDVLGSREDVLRPRLAQVYMPYVWVKGVACGKHVLLCVGLCVGLCVRCGVSHNKCASSYTHAHHVHTPKTHTLTRLLRSLDENATLLQKLAGVNELGKACMYILSSLARLGFKPGVVQHSILSGTAVPSLGTRGVDKTRGGLPEYSECILPSYFVDEPYMQGALDREQAAYDKNPLPASPPPEVQAETPHATPPSSPQPSVKKKKKKVTPLLFQGHETTLIAHVCTGLFRYSSRMTPSERARVLWALGELQLGTSHWFMCLPSSRWTHPNAPHTPTPHPNAPHHDHDGMMMSTQHHHHKCKWVMPTMGASFQRLRNHVYGLANHLMSNHRYWMIGRTRNNEKAHDMRLYAPPGDVIMALHGAAMLGIATSADVFATLVMCSRPLLARNLTAEMLQPLVHVLTVWRDGMLCGTEEVLFTNTPGPVCWTGGQLYGGFPAMWSDEVKVAGLCREYSEQRGVRYEQGLQWLEGVLQGRLVAGRPVTGGEGGGGDVGRGGGGGGEMQHNQNLQPNISNSGKTNHGKSNPERGAQSAAHDHPVHAHPVDTTQTYDFKINAMQARLEKQVWLHYQWKRALELRSISVQAWLERDVSGWGGALMLQTEYMEVCGGV